LDICGTNISEFIQGRTTINQHQSYLFHVLRLRVAAGKHLHRGVDTILVHGEDSRHVIVHAIHLADHQRGDVRGGLRDEAEDDGERRARVAVRGEKLDKDVFRLVHHNVLEVLTA
jgi:hypothetical protein